MKSSGKNAGSLPANVQPDPQAAAAPARGSVRGRIVTTVLAALLAVGGWRSINYISGTRPDVDSGVFLSCAYHMRMSKALYRDVWDHKPPGIHFINYAALGHGDVNAVRALERVLAAAAVLVLYFLVLRLFGRRWIAFVTGLLFLTYFYSPSVFARGNLTEEYGGIFLLCGMAVAIVAIRRVGFVAFAMAAASGAAMSAAALTKEPFALMALPWFVYLAWPFDRRWGAGAMRAGAFVLGAGIPAALAAWYLSAHAVWGDFLDTVAFNMVAMTGTPQGLLGKLQATFEALKTRTTSALVPVGALLAVGFASLFDRRFVRRDREALIPVAACTVLGVVAASLNDRYSAHYYMQLAPPLVLLAAFALAYLDDLGRNMPVGRRTLAAMGLCALLAMDVSSLWGMAQRMASPRLRFTGDAFSRYIAENTRPGDFVYAPTNPVYYVVTDRPCPIRLHFMFAHLFAGTPAATAEEKRKAFVRQLLASPPKVIILGPPGGLAHFEHVGLLDWVKANYGIALTSEDKTEVLLVPRRDRGLPSAGPPGRSPADGLPWSPGP